MDTTESIKIRHATESTLFGELVKLATPRLKAYYSDLYYDVLWIQKNWNDIKDNGFYFSVRDSGTNIGQDRFAVIDHPESCAGFRINLRVEKTTCSPTGEYVYAEIKPSSK